MTITQMQQNVETLTKAKQRKVRKLFEQYEKLEAELIAANKAALLTNQELDRVITRLENAFGVEMAFTSCAGTMSF
jgi:Cdc6-like AAA superfamily ATPase